MHSSWLSVCLLASLPVIATPTYEYGSCTGTSGATQLTVVETTLTVNGKASSVFQVKNSQGLPYILKREGECFNVVVNNHTSVPTALHWHGLILPPLDDGAAWVTQHPIPPGQSQAYNFEIVQSGTFWVHSHYGLQEQKLMTIPLILLPKEDESYRDIVFMFEAFTSKSLEEVWLGLRKGMMQALKTHGTDWIPPLHQKMKPSAPMDVEDVDFDAYLTNRRTLEAPEVQVVQPGEKLRLRLINGSVGCGFHISIGELEGEIIAVDGNPVEPIRRRQFPLAAAQRVDVLVVIPSGEGVYPIVAYAEGTDQITAGILKTEKAKLPAYRSTTDVTVGPITNKIERELHAREPLEPRPVDRTLRLTLAGNMKDYAWAINGHLWPNDQQVTVKKGERVELIFVNQSHMSHPMHLHGHMFQITEIDGEAFSGALRDTVLVCPGQTVKVEFDADNPGIWALHCHIAYHRWAGMFTTLLYDGYEPPHFTKQQIHDYSRIYGGY